LIDDHSDLTSDVSPQKLESAKLIPNKPAYK